MGISYVAGPDGDIRISLLTITSDSPAIDSTCRATYLKDDATVKHESLPYHSPSDAYASITKSRSLSLGRVRNLRPPCLGRAGYHLLLTFDRHPDASFFELNSTAQIL